MFQVKTVIVRFVRMSEFGVECAASFERMIPRHRVIGSVLPALVGRLINFDEYRYGIVQIFEVVPFIFSLPGVRESGSGGMIFVNDQQRSLLLFGMPEKPG